MQQADASEINCTRKGMGSDEELLMSTLSALDEINKLQLAVVIARNTLERIDPIPGSVLEEEVDDYFGFS